MLVKFANQNVSLFKQTELMQNYISHSGIALRT